MSKAILRRLQEDALFNINDPDGLMFMIDHDFAGCTVMLFTKAMDESMPGKVYIDGKQGKYVLKKNADFGMFVGMKYAYLLGVKLWGYLTEYEQTVEIRVEGFCDTEGHEMEPAVFTIRAIEACKPEPKYAENEVIALQAAEEGIVLLKNENSLLPLSPDSYLNIFGRAYREFRTSAVGAGKINPRYIVGFNDAIETFSSFKINKELDEIYKKGSDSIPSEDILNRAKEKNDVGIVVIGRASGENVDNLAEKGDYYLTDEEDLLLSKVTERFTKTIVILNVGYPIDVSFIEKYGVDSVIYCGYPGMLGGKALVEVLDGRVNPSGKLPDTWAKDIKDIPADKNFYKNTSGNILDGNARVWIDTVYEEDIYVGYRYFSSFGVAPAFPFGYGLSYTNFSITLKDFSYVPNVGCKVAATVKNFGKMAGKEAVQIYISKPDGRYEKPSIELVGFEKTKLLEVNETELMSFALSEKHFTYYDEKAAAYIMDAGEYIVYAGSSSDVLQEVGRFALEKPRIIKQVTNRVRPVQEIKTLSVRAEKESKPNGKHTGIKSGVTDFEPKAVRRNDFISFCAPQEIDKIVNGLSAAELARLVVCASSGWGMENVGGAGSIYKIDGLELPDFIVADGNSGVNIKKRNIGMPSGVTICATFNKQLAQEIGKVIGREAKENGISLILAPGMNIHRHPLCGRHPEYFSEDPYLAGIMAGHYCKGLESTGTGGCLKHCIANNTETARKRNQSIMTERALREIYFKAFEIAMDVHMPVSIMTAYNAVNGCPTSSDSELLDGLFRAECGFDGFIMTDWATYDSVDFIEMLIGGNNWIAPGSNDDSFTKPIVDAVASGRLSLNRLKESVKYLLCIIYKLEKRKEL